MTKLFTQEQIDILNASPYILKVSESTISYGDHFYYELSRLLKQNIPRDEALDLLGLPPEILGVQRIKRLIDRLRVLEKNGDLINTPQLSAPEKSLLARYLALEKENLTLKQEVEFLKKKSELDTKSNHLKQ